MVRRRQTRQAHRLEEDTQRHLQDGAVVSASGVRRHPAPDRPGRPRLFEQVYEPSHRHPQSKLTTRSELNARAHTGTVRGAGMGGDVPTTTTTTTLRKT